MADETPTAFTADSAARIARVVKEAERNPARHPIGGDTDLPTMGGNWQFLKVTGAATGGDTGCDPPDDADGLTATTYYPAIIRQYNSDTEAWEDTGHNVWVTPAPGQTLANNDYVVARQSRTNACILGDSRPLFAMVKQAGSSAPTWCLGPFLYAYTCVDNHDGTFTATLDWRYAHFDGTTLTMNTTPC